jgi:hypothetical protein
MCVLNAAGATHSRVRPIAVSVRYLCHEQLIVSCDCGLASANTENERKTLRIALVLNAIMFVVGMAAGLWAKSTGLLAHALDMLTGATANGLGLMAVTRGTQFKQCSARWTAATLMRLGRRYRRRDSAFLVRKRPARCGNGRVSLFSLGVNLTVLRMLAQYR